MTRCYHQVFNTKEDTQLSKVFAGKVVTIIGKYVRQDAETDQRVIKK